ncbi:protein eyes shut homolog [Vidua chalybeata]|uniref:protein eyes shut homolog n=1 Tax=Vidua chalybeata TaxID=81927 RepID=UPI0023A7D8C8|nr:protein eyes shut homolog [Vidua chalybeata]
MTTKSAFCMVVCFLQLCIVSGQIICERQMITEWRTEPKPTIIKWTPRENVCSDFYTECWNMNKSIVGEISEERNLSMPQICPLQLQLGDSLFISSEPSFQSYGMNLVNVSKEEFINCPKAGFLQEQLIFVCQIKGLHQVNPNWLGVGTHYFAELHKRGPLLCNMGLRLNVTVKQQFCQQSLGAPLCSGHGKCQSHIWEKTYNCHCFSQYSGTFCQKFDICSTKPCHNNASCTEKSELSGDSYKCTCPPKFSGKNCTEIVGQCQPSTCFNGNCINVTPNTFLCECDMGFTGPFCEEPGHPCASQPCLNGGICHYNQSGYVCNCPSGFLGHNCEIDINECSSRPCQNRGTCIDLPNDVACICMPIFTGKFCERILNPCELLPCLNNATCVAHQQNYHCRCMPGFTGKNCEEIIDYCRLLSINCLNEGLCLNIIGGFTCLCAPGWTGEFCQFAENACLIYRNNCSDGATCIDMSQLREQPLFQCLCPRDFTGEFCEVQIDNCGSNSCENGGTCIGYEDHFKCTCPTGFEGERCELDIDACLFNNISCAPGALCMDKSHGFNYTCLSPCIGNTEVCANGGSCFYDEENQRSHCVCALGWTGNTCLENINDCEINQCQHGATCEDGINKYRCICPLGYTGTFCELDIDNCIGNQCSQYGFCQDHLHNYSCYCVPGYEGPFCEVEVNECSSSPCKNGATCMDLSGHFSCHCTAGFTGETCSVHINECQDRPCWNGGTCEKDISGFKCNCPFGFSGQYCETEMNECDSAPCLNGAVCQNDVNSYDCFCPEGFEGLNCEINFDECTYGFCKSNSTCLDLVADYSCACPPGFTDKNCSTDIDECSSKPCKNGGHCHDLIGEFYCSCLPGFTGELCEANVAACLSQPCGASSICKDTVGGYLCFCAPGFIGHNCDIEVDECLSDPCHNGATCVDHLNAFSCICQDGFEGTTCEANINECQSSPCLQNASCADLIGGYKCVCLPGFTGARCETDIDECASFPCKNGATCIDRPGNYFCQCVAPFKGLNCEFRPCEASTPCENGAVCIEEMNLDVFPLGFHCQCVKGFAGPRCEINVNECSSNPCLHGYCYDIVDGFYCLCNPGYAGLKCDQDIDDCIVNACEHNSTCVDLHLRYQCDCLPGWEGKFCEKESNECNSEPCRNNGTCMDLFNSYRCTCTAGWRGPDCSEDINECESEPCLNGATCFESVKPGQFVCICPPFYTGDFCHQRFSPCELPYNPCINNSTCLAQVDGNPMCICKTGFEGTYCEVNSDDCISQPCQNGGLCVDGVNHYRCSCQHGFTGTLCEVEINECLSRPCKNNGTCLDLVNRFICNCAPGYYGSLCEMDVNECETLPCLHGGSCINRLGGYRCLCLPGFTGDRCEVNIDECMSSPCLNNGSCIDGISSYKCHCKQGFIGTNCEINVNECLPNPCLHGRCIDLIDGYQCSCEPGWTSSRCEININECESAPCINGGSCQDAINAFVCVCMSGYTGRFCEVDVDVCSESTLNSVLCYNEGVCVDGPGRTFHCRCLAGFSGQFCEIEVNECNSSPCLHGSTCADHINGYTCKCQQGWEGLHCELDVDECISNPCIHGICVQKEPSFGYSCFCKPGFVGRSCELNYNDCLIHSCSTGFLCVDGINNITCLPTMPQSKKTLTEVAEVFPAKILDNDLPSVQAVSMELLSKHVSPDLHTGEVSKDFSYAHYYGDSYLEFQGLHLNMQNFIHIEFKTNDPHGLLLNIEQSPETIRHFLIRLVIHNGTLQYQYLCDDAAEVKNISTTARVDNGHWYNVQIRQSMVPCEAEMSILKLSSNTSITRNFWSTSYWLETGSIFVGGLPHPHAAKEVSGPVYNFTGCIKVVEINNVGPFSFSNAVGRSNVDNCRISVPTRLSTAFPVVSSDVPHLPDPGVPSQISPAFPSVCQEGLCHNGGTCHPLSLPTGTPSFRCDCPLHFTGRFCEKDIALFFPSFTGNSYLELPSLTSVSDTRTASEQETSNLTTLYLTVKTTALNGTILYTGERNFGEQFLHLYLVEGRPTVRLGCGNSQNILTVSLNQSISKGMLVPITISYMLPVGTPEGHCMIEVAADGNPPVQHRLSFSHRASQINFGSIFLGKVPVHEEVHRCAGQIYGYKGCIRDFQVNHKELFIIDEALEGRNVENCNVPICDYHPCHNGGTCTSDEENWYCECPKLYTGKLCQFATCDENPCGNGATCFPKSRRDAVCLCPYGRAGILCSDAINITQPSFSGTDIFGYTSFLAYSTIPNITFYYEFRLKFWLANHHSALQDNLIFFTGQKGQGLNGDDFLELGLRNGRVVYSYNLGSGTATIISKPLDLTLNVHVIHLGRNLQKGWLKVDDQKNKTVTSPGRLVGLNVFSQFYLGGYREYIPELLPKGHRFKNGFQGCIFDVQVRTSLDQGFKSPGTPEGHPNSGRSVGQCKDSPCSLIKCRNGGKCIESGSTVYCDCLTGWKGAFCTETVSVCEPEHDPPHLCQQGSTCVPLPSGYMCHCPLGTTGTYCEQDISISDASFRNNESSWMSFAPFYIRHKTHIKLQFQPLSPDGILFYTAQHLGSQSGDFLCISLVNGFTQLRYNLGDRTVILQTLQKVHTNGNTWHLLNAGRVGNEGYLDLDGINITQKASPGMNALDTHSDFFVGGVSSLNLVNPMAIENEPTGFTGCIREIVINNRELNLTVTDPKGGANIGDCDGTACGYTVCKNNGTCQVENSGFSCSCPREWTGTTCEQSIHCSQNMCGSHALCIPQPSSFSYTCACALGWTGKYCDTKIKFYIAKFVGNSYIKYTDPFYGKRDLQYSRLSLNFTTNQTEGLIAWMGKSEDEDNDFLAIGLANGTLKVVINLGERISVPLMHSKYFTCSDGRWHFTTVVQNQTCIKVYLDEELIFFEDIDPQRKYTALNYGGICYFGGFEIGRKVNIVTIGLFQKELIGKIKDVVLFQDSKKIQLMKAEGYNIHDGNSEN